ncbi:MAG: phosphohydrolase [Defluviitaleaceae bacterium]|nr:phosphohydrolase [Defluviitaleaceae bacterium]
MDYITTFTGEDFTPLSPDVGQIHIHDIAHALSLMCRANGHFSRFFSVAQHSINCCNEAKARGLSDKIQLACLLHDASEAYLSDITKPVKNHLARYIEFEEFLQNMIYNKFLGEGLSEDECKQIKQIDDDMLKHEFKALMIKQVFNDVPCLYSNPSFEFLNFIDVENEFIRVYNKLTKS